MKRKTYIKPYVTISVTEQESPLCSSGTTPVRPQSVLQGIQGVANNTETIWIGDKDFMKEQGMYPVIDDAKGDNLWDEWE